MYALLEKVVNLHVGIFQEIFVHWLDTIRTDNYRPHPKDGGRWEGTVFSLFVSSHRGGGVPRPRSSGVPHLRLGGVPHPRLGGVPHPGLDAGGGLPWPGLDWGGYPGQVLMVGGVPWVSPQLGLDHGEGGTPTIKTWLGYPPTPGWATPWTWDGVPPPRPGMGYHPLPTRQQHSEHFLCGRRYASCVHAGGLSCYMSIGFSFYSW